MMTIDKETMGSSSSNGLSPNVLKRKNEDCVDLEAEIKRVALDDEEADNEGNSKSELSSDDRNSSYTSTELDPKTNIQSQDISLRMLCLVKQASIIVGPKGESINKLKEQTSTKVNVSPNIRGVPERVIHVKGSCENVGKAFGKIARIIIEKDSKNNANQSSSSLDSEASQNSSDAEDTTLILNLLISHALMGSVIGKGGSQLREIEERSAAKLYASPNQLMMSNDRILSITGVPDAIHIATYYVAQSLLNCREELKQRKSIFYQPSQMGSALPNSYGAQMYNKFPHQMHHQYHPMDKYNTPRNKKSHRLPRPQSMLANNVPPSINGHAFHDEYMNRPESGQIHYTSANVASAPSFTPTRNIPNVRIVDNPENNMAYSNPIAPVKQDIYIDENFVGNIIGKEGKHINSVKESTGCAIFIDNRIEGVSERKLTIKGTYMALQAAIMLISNKIEIDRANFEKS